MCQIALGDITQPLDKQKDVLFRGYVNESELLLPIILGTCFTVRKYSDSLFVWVRVLPSINSLN